MTSLTDQSLSAVYIPPPKAPAAFATQPVPKIKLGVLDDDDDLDDCPVSRKYSTKPRDMV